MPEAYEPTDAIKMARNASFKRVRTSARCEGSIIIDYFLQPVLEAVDQAVSELGKEVVSTDWIREAIISGIDKEKITQVAHAKIMEAQLGYRELGSGS